MVVANRPASGFLQAPGNIRVARVRRNALARHLSDFQMDASICSASMRTFALMRSSTVSRWPCVSSSLRYSQAKGSARNLISSVKPAFASAFINLGRVKAIYERGVLPLPSQTDTERVGNNVFVYCQNRRLMDRHPISRELGGDDTSALPRAAAEGDRGRHRVPGGAPARKVPRENFSL
jgi:hypothetical protein